MLEKLKEITGKWWLVFALGVIAAICSVLMVVNVVSTFEAISSIVCVFFLILGIVQIITTISRRKEIPSWGWNLAAAIIMTIFAILILVTPLAKETLVITMFQVAFLFEGMYMISYAIALKQEGVKGWGWLLAFGIITTIGGIILMATDVLGVVSMDVISIMAAISMMSLGINLMIVGITMSKIKGGIKQVEEYGEQLEKEYKDYEKKLEDNYAKFEKEAEKAVKELMEDEK